MSARSRSRSRSIRLDNLSSDRKPTEKQAVVGRLKERELFKTPFFLLTPFPSLFQRYLLSVGVRWQQSPFITPKFHFSSPVASKSSLSIVQSDFFQACT